MKKVKYLSIYEDIKNTILDGTYPIHSKLPSKRELSGFYNVSVITIDRAYQQLITEGYVLSIERKGYYVNEMPQHLFYHAKNRDHNHTNIHDANEQKYTQINTYFPHSTWAKLSRRVLSDHQNMMDSPVDPQGLMGLRHEIVKFLEIYRGIHASVEQIVIGSGSQAMIQLLIALIGRSYTFVMEEPGFTRLKNIVRYSGVQVNTVLLDSQGALINRIDTNQPTIVHITPSHQYPKGIVMPIARRIECLNWVSSNPDRYILEDDYDSEFRFQGQPIPALQSLDQTSRVIYMNTFSKSLSPSLKINYLVLPKSLLAQYQNIKHMMPCSVPIFEQLVLMEFMKNQYFEKHLNRVKKIYRKKALYVIEKLNDVPFINISGFESGLHMILTLDETLDINKFFDHLNQQGIHLKRMLDFYDDKPDECQDFLLEYASMEDVDLLKTINILVDTIILLKNNIFDIIS